VRPPGHRRSFDGRRGVILDLSKPEGESDFYFVQADDAEIAVQRIVELAKTRIPPRVGLDPIQEIQVLCPMSRGGIGARSLNIERQGVLNPAGELTASFERAAIKHAAEAGRT
jgi:exodeoxyribonuclease V alpha subunit